MCCVGVYGPDPGVVLLVMSVSLPSLQATTRTSYLQAPEQARIQSMHVPGPLQNATS